MTFDEFIAERREQLLQPNKSASTIKLVDQCDRADNTMCKIFLIYQIKHYPEAVKAINGNSIGTRPLSRPRLNDYPRLTSDRTTNPNSNIALKADILLTIPRIQRKIINDDEQTIKDSDHIMRVADSAQGGIACELTFDDLRFSPNNFMSKIDKPTSLVYISAVHGTDRLKVVGNGLDNHKMCLANDKPLLTSSMSARYKPDGKVMIEGKEYINELYNPITAIRTKTPEPIDCEDRYKEPREKPRTCSTAHAKRYIFSSSLDIPASEDEYGSEGLQLRTVVNAIAFPASSATQLLRQPLAGTRLRQSAEDHRELFEWSRFQRFVHFCPTPWTHEPVHTVDRRCIATSWTSGSAQAELWRDV